MNNRRWVALAIAVGLFLISIVFRFTANMATTDFEEAFGFWDRPFDENVIEEGNFNEKIAVLHVEGVIQDVSTNELLSSTAYNHKGFLEMLRHAAMDNTVEGIILRVNTPGGGVVESAEIHDQIAEIQEEYEKPVYISMGNTAASGGYYISAPADKIVAHPATVTGSIGVIMESINFSELADDLGIDFNTIKSGEYKDIMSATRDMTEEEFEILQTIIDEMYDDFVQVIADGRGMDEDEVRNLGDGRVYTGQQAYENGLVDDLGSMDDTISMLRDDYDLQQASVIEYEANAGFSQYLMGTIQSTFGSPDVNILGLQELFRQSNAPSAMYLYTK
ncbi:signal peptide peptidase SppA [Virgibacillus sp. YIM 98842]|uniref:signal peptide peptidase SppA n=1 Tax=Virgibacillus sp. YIM 98842 TaxID=2663533 RepID=UPI0013D8E9F5|nr:signal peptide peptidase SppA [Virgibacillus sp. YIM 98842]